MTNTESSVRKNKRTYTVSDKKKHYKVNATYTEYDNKRSKKILCGWQCDECKRIVTNNYCKCNPQGYKAHKARLENGQLMRHLQGKKNMSTTCIRKSEDRIGCPLEEFAESLVRQSGNPDIITMWSIAYPIDHKISLKSLDLSNAADTAKANHYTNMHIIPKKENQSKGSKCVVIEEVDDDDACNPQIDERLINQAFERLPVLKAERLVESKKIEEPIVVMEVDDDDDDDDDAYNPPNEHCVSLSVTSMEEEGNNQFVVGEEVPYHPENNLSMGDAIDKLTCILANAKAMSKENSDKEKLISSMLTSRREQDKASLKKLHKVAKGRRTTIKMWKRDQKNFKMQMKTHVEKVKAYAKILKQNEFGVAEIKV